jgi:hypothetical protein
MDERTTPATPLLTEFVTLLQAHRAAVGQERVFVRLSMLTLGSLLALGRHTITQLLVALGRGQDDWSAWYRLFNVPRVALDRLQVILVAEVARHLPANEVFPVVLDATQLPRSGRRFPGSGWVRAPRSPAWKPGLHGGQRWEGLSALLPRSAQGDSRTVPLRFALLRSAKSHPCGGVPERTEGALGVELLGWLRDHLDALGRTGQRILVIADGVYSTAPVIANLPRATVLLARCAKNRALYALPGPRADGTRGRNRRYGDRGPTPQQALHARDGWKRRTITVRGRQIRLTVRVSGPWLVKPAAAHPLWFPVVTGVERGTGRRRRKREPSFLVASAVPADAGGWDLPLPVDELLAWAWQRWEVEVMHRELKSSFGLGEQQAWSPPAAQTVVPWVVWTYALVVLTGYRTWGFGPGPVPDLGRWWTARRWSLGRLGQGMRQELWQQADFQPVWARSPDAWTGMTGWIALQTNAALGARHL